MRVEKDEKDPSIRYVYGKVTDGGLDTDDQIVDPAFARKALADWYDTGANVRQMHATTLPPAGKGVLLEHKEGNKDGSDGEWVRTKVVEPVAVKLVDEGVYTGYSVGISRPRLDRDMKARNGRIVGGKIVEISLVDRPALPSAKFAVLKAASGRGSLQFVGKVVMLSEPVGAGVKRGPRVVKQLQKGMHVTAHVRSGNAGTEAIEGRVTQQTQFGFTLDVRGYDRAGGDRAIDRTDVIAIYKGSAPDLASPDVQKGGFLHAHTHIGPDGLPHKHEHSHTAGASDHSELHEGGPHAHGHSTEDSVADDQKPQDADDDGDAGANAAGEDADADDSSVADKAACAHEFGDDEKCSKCGSMKAAEADTTKGEAADEAGAAVDKAAKKAAKKAEKISKKIRVESVEGGFTVMKGTKVVAGPFPDATGAQAEILARKTARKAARAEKVKRATVAALEKTPLVVKRLHDATCAAYAEGDVVAMLGNGGTATMLGKASRQALYETITAEISKGNPDNVAGLSKAIAALNDLRRAEKRGGEDTTKAIDAAHAELNIVFKMANGLTEASAEGLPKPTDADISAGQFKRPYIRAGHQDPGGSGHGKAKIPQTTHPISANDFGRGPLTEGHQRYISAKLADLHDGISSWRPEICRMDARGSMAFDRQPNASDPTGGSRAEPVLAFKAVDNKASSGPTPVDPGKTKRAPGEKVAKAKTVKLAKTRKIKGMKPVSADRITAIVAAATSPLLTKITSLEGTVNELAAAPDTSRSATRGVTGYPARIDKAATDKGQKKSARRGNKAEKIDYMRSLATAGDPAQRIEATDWLASRGIDN